MVIKGTPGAVDTTYFTLEAGFEQEFMVEVNVGDILALVYNATGPDNEQNGMQLLLFGVPVFYSFDLTPDALIYAVLCDCTPPPFDQSECVGGYWLCDPLGPSQSFPLSGPNWIDDLDATNGGCLVQENRGAWFWISLEDVGELEFTINPIAGTFGDMRVDFALWSMPPGPWCPMSEPPIRCSAADVTGPKGLVNGATDVTQGAVGDCWLAPVSVNGSWYGADVYVLYVDNPTPYNFNITLEFTGGVGPACTVTALDGLTATDPAPMLWPNPANGLLHMGWLDGVSRPMNWRVLDATGRLLLEGHDQGEGRTGIEPLGPGSYILHWQFVGTGAIGAAHFV